MRLHRFYITDPLEGKSVVVTNRDLIHQWRKVFRYNVGSQVIVFNGSGVECHCAIMKMSPSEAELSVLTTKEIAAPTKNIWLCLSLIKKDNFELVVQKAVELGVSHVVPIVAERSEKKNIHTERLNKIIVEATEQSGRGELLTVHDVTTLEHLFEKGSLPQEKIFFHPGYPEIKKYLSSDTGQYSVAYFVGPEGGWSEKEIEVFKKYNMNGFSLGTRILRAETAAITGAVLLGM